MNNTTILLTRTVLSAVSQMADANTDSSVILPYLCIVLGVCALGLFVYSKTSMANLNSIRGDNDFNSIPLDVLNDNNTPARVTHIATPDRALSQPNWRWDNHPINREIMDRRIPQGDQNISHQEIDITDDDVLDLSTHFRNISDPLRDRSIPHHDVRPDSTTRGLDEVDITGDTHVMEQAVTNTLSQVISNTDHQQVNIRSNEGIDLADSINLDLFI